MLRTFAICIVALLAATGPVLAQSATSRPAGAASPAHPSATAPSTLASDQFSSEEAAKSHCPADTVVWVNLGGSKAYHVSGDKYYGKTKHGAYMCQKEADQSGFHAAGRRASPSAAKSTSTKAPK
jgi:hypothetical protein